VCGIHKLSVAGRRRAQHKKTPKDLGDLWYFLAALARKLATESQEASYGDLQHLATGMIQ